MIIVQTPLRISFFGGGTDFPSFFMEEGGCVLSSAIDKYIFVTVKERFDHKLRIGYTQTEMVDSIDEIQHELIRESLRLTGISNGLEVTTMGDIPSEGSGLGLALCKKYVEVLGGKIEVTTRLGVGTTFVISLPKTRDL